MNEERIYTYRLTHKVRTGGSSVFACLFYLAAVPMFFIIGPFVLIFLAIGWAVDQKHKLISTCGHCGNEVSHTSHLCPTCHADLASETTAPMHWFTKLNYTILILGILLLLVLYHLRQHPSS